METPLAQAFALHAAAASRHGAGKGGPTYRDRAILRALAGES